MNFTKTFKWQLVLVALGASLVLTSRAYSQEIENTDFQAPAASVGGNFNASASTPLNAAAANSQQVYTPAAGAAIQATNEMGELGTSSFSLTAGPLLAIVLVALGCILVKKVSAKRRNNGQTRSNAQNTRKTPLFTNKAQVLNS